MYANVRKFRGLVLVAAVLLLTGLTAVSAFAQDRSANDVMPKNVATAASAGTYVLKVEDVKPCPAEVENTCWTVRAIRGADGAFLMFYWENPTNLWQDGWRFEPGYGMLTGIPPKWSGLVEGFTFRYTGSLPGEEVPSSMPLTLSDAPLAAPAVKTAEVTPSVVASTAPVSITYPVMAYALNDGSRSNVRASTTVSSALLYRLEPGASVTLTGQSNVSGVVWYGVSPKGYLRGDRVQFDMPVPVKPAAESAKTTSAGVPASSSASAPPCVTAPATLKWTSLGNNAWAWNTYKNGDGNPVEMTLSSGQDGEYVDSSGAHSPIPAGKHNVTGITARCD